MADTKTATEAPKTLPWPLSVLLSCLGGANVPCAHLLAYLGDLSPGISCTLVKCTISRGTNHPSTPKGWQMVEWPQQDGYKGPKNPCRGPLSVLLSCLGGAIVPFAHLVAYLGDLSPGISCTLVKCRISRGINHPSTPKGRQMVEWPQQNSYKGPENPAVAPLGPSQLSCWDHCAICPPFGVLG